MERTHCGTLSRSNVGERVLLKGWVQRRRDLGGLLFLDLRDRSGLCQIVIRPEERANLVELLAPVRAEWVLEVEGAVRVREAINERMPTGQVEVAA
ncbi:MAG: OB-fold nucleic acid binding domain-containing protein, partial [Myxococcota bacterium]